MKADRTRDAITFRGMLADLETRLRDERRDISAADLAGALVACANLRDRLGVPLTMPLGDYDGPDFDRDDGGA